MSRVGQLALGLWAVCALVAGLAAAQTGPGASKAEDTGEGLPLLFEIRLDHEEITVGDPIEVELMVVWMGEEPDGEVRFPVWQEDWGRAEILSAEPVQSITDQSARRIWTQKLRVTAFRTGDFELPGVTVALPLGERTLEARSKPATFSVVSVLPPPEESATDPDAPSGEGEGAEAEIPDPKPAAPPRELAPSRPWFWFAVGGFAFLLALALWRLAVVAGRQGDEVSLAAEPDDPLRFLAPLDELGERLRRIDPAWGAEPVHTWISHSLRIYLRRRLHFPAIESTTTEIQRTLHRAALSSDLAQRVGRLLRAADAAKYARADVDPDTCRRRIAEARDAAQEIEQQMAPVQRLIDQADARDGKGDAMGRAA